MRQYHIGIDEGEVAPYVLLVGDPQRAARVATKFDHITVERKNREFHTITGFYKGVPVTVMGTGIGCDNMEIAVVELSQIKQNLTLIRVGSSGALQANINLGDLVISTGAVRLENTSTAFVPEGFPAIAHHEVVMALTKAARAGKFPSHVGLTASASGFYGAQGRTLGRFASKFEHLPMEMRRIGVLNMEMESSTLFTLAQLGGLRAGTICAIWGQRTVGYRNHDIVADHKVKEASEWAAIKTALGAIEILSTDKRGKDRRSNNVDWLMGTVKSKDERTKVRRKHESKK